MIAAACCRVFCFSPRAVQKFIDFYRTMRLAVETQLRKAQSRPSPTRFAELSLPQGRLCASVAATLVARRDFGTALPSGRDSVAPWPGPEKDYSLNKLSASARRTASWRFLTPSLP